VLQSPVAAAARAARRDRARGDHRRPRPPWRRARCPSRGGTRVTQKRNRSKRWEMSQPRHAQRPRSAVSCRLAPPLRLPDPTAPHSCHGVPVWCRAPAPRRRRPCHLNHRPSENPPNYLMRLLPYRIHQLALRRPRVSAFPPMPARDSSPTRPPSSPPRLADCSGRPRVFMIRIC